MLRVVFHNLPPELAAHRVTASLHRTTEGWRVARIEAGPYREETEQ